MNGGWLASAQKFVSAALNGVPPGEDVTPYTFAVTSVISIYICAILAFLAILAIRRVQRADGGPPERRQMLLWVFTGALGALAATALYIASML